MQPTMQKNNVKQRKTIAIIAMIAVAAIALAAVAIIAVSNQARNDTSRQRRLHVECEGARHASAEL